ncbi:hypothetical protein ANO14919_032700 [Xylariales sp. No.14919]|nr:hypothetical protein ANO14919_032700 [Xylariales sp. No.14919]
MKRCNPALAALVLVIPALAAPGPILTSLTQPLTGEPWELTTVAAAIHDKFQPTISLPPIPTLPAVATKTPSPTDPVKRNKKNNKHKPDNNWCTPGDRACHASLDEVLFCNDNRQWVRYSQCQRGTFCHRLFMVCVREIYAPDPKPRALEPRQDDGGRHQCKEGDRRCNANFNRVDRCNDQHDWVTYHDCRKSECCDEKIQECLPITSSDQPGDDEPMVPGGLGIRNGTDISNDAATHTA